MRIQNKFKFYFKEKNFIYNCPKKIKKFKRTKWILYQNIIKKKIKRKFFVNPIIIARKGDKNKGIGWDKKKQFFKKKIRIRRLFFHIYDNILTKKNFKNVSKKFSNLELNPINFLKNSIIKFEFISCIFLFRLNFFSSVYESKKAITNGLVLLNNKTFSSSTFLKAGDVISFSYKHINLKKILENKFQKSVFYPFIEADFYTNTIIIVKDFEYLSIEDITLFYVQHINLPKLRLTF